MKLSHHSSVHIQALLDIPVLTVLSFCASEKLLGAKYKPIKDNTKAIVTPIVQNIFQGYSLMYARNDQKMFLSVGPSGKPARGSAFLWAARSHLQQQILTWSLSALIWYNCNPALCCLDDWIQHTEMKNQGPAELLSGKQMCLSGERKTHFSFKKKQNKLNKIIVNFLNSYSSIQHILSTYFSSSAENKLQAF